MAAAILFVVSSTLDNITTYEFVVVRGEYVEANPFLVPFIYTQPLHIWFLRDALLLALLVVEALAFRWLLLRLYRRRPQAQALMKLADSHWVIVAAAALFKAAAAAHNLLLVTLDIETPLPQLLT